jgi:hypothetical protein
MHLITSVGLSRSIYPLTASPYTQRCPQTREQDVYGRSSTAGGIGDGWVSRSGAADIEGTFGIVRPYVS